MTFFQLTKKEGDVIVTDDEDEIVEHAKPAVKNIKRENERKVQINVHLTLHFYAKIYIALTLLLLF